MDDISEFLIGFIERNNMNIFPVEQVISESQHSKKNFILIVIMLDMMI